jgi:hypothetical protein
LKSGIPETLTPNFNLPQKVYSPKGKGPADIFSSYVLEFLPFSETTIISTTKFGGDVSTWTSSPDSTISPLTWIVAELFSEVTTREILRGNAGKITEYSVTSGEKGGEKSASTSLNITVIELKEALPSKDSSVSKMLHEININIITKKQIFHFII